MNEEISEEKKKHFRDNLVRTIDMLIESGVPISHIVIANKHALKVNYRDRIDRLEKENKELREKLNQRDGEER